MCNISGYIGDRQAAPILIELMKRQSGYGGGSYTGLATIHEGKIYYAKVIGDVDRLVAETNAMELPGTIGILHSRSNSGGDWKWSHPFISNDESFAYVANGSAGSFRDVERRDVMTQMLEKKGVKFTSAGPAIEHYPRLSDGQGVHVSETMCHLADYYIKEGCTPVEGLRKAFLTDPAEIVALALHVSCPDRILAARHNQPMMLGRTATEMFLGTTALSFPDDREYISIDMLPPACSAEIFRDGWKVKSFEAPPKPVAPINGSVFGRGYNIIVDALKNSPEPVTMPSLCPLVKPLWGEGQLNQGSMLVYEVLRGLNAEGRLGVEYRTEPGPAAAPGVTTTKFYVYLKD